MPHEKRAMPAAGRYAGLELERRRVAEPARQRLARTPPCMALGDARRTPARPARRSGTCSRSRPRSRRRRASQVDRHRAGGMRQVPDRRARLRSCASRVSAAMSCIAPAAVVRRGSASAPRPPRRSPRRCPRPVDEPQLDGRPAARRAPSACRDRSGSCSRSETITRRPCGRRSERGGASTLNRLTEVESATITSPGRGADQRARSCRRRAAAASIQPAAFQLRISPSPHSRSHDLGHARGGRLRQRPSELPSR